MKILTLFAIIFFSLDTFAAGGPTSIGSISIGMSKAEYISAIGITPIDCNTNKDWGGGVMRAEMKDLMPDVKRLCYDFRAENRTGIVENIQVGDISYDFVEANYQSSKLIESIGNSCEAIFLKDRLIRLELYNPKVSIKKLATKYGSPKIFDNTKIEICQNGIGNKFENKVGSIDAVWTNGEAMAILRKVLLPPSVTCTDGYDMDHYILEERGQLKLIESAINIFRKDIDKTAENDSVF